MTDLKKLTDDELHERWVAALQATCDTSVTIPMISGDGSSMDEFRCRQDALDAIEAETTRRARKRQREGAGKIRWEPTYMIATGSGSASVKLSGWEAVVGGQLVGHVSCPGRAGKQRWGWRVSQCCSGMISSGELASLAQAKEAVEKRVWKWFKQAGVPLAA